MVQNNVKKKYFEELAFNLQREVQKVLNMSSPKHCLKSSAFSMLLMELGASMMVASTIVPPSLFAS